MSRSKQYSSEAIRERAQRRLRSLQRRRRDARYVTVMGRFVREGLLVVNTELPLNCSRLDVADVLWAGEVEPRLLELLPALLVKRPALFVDTGELPQDLAQAVRSVRRNVEPETFRNISGKQILRWLPLLGRKNKVPSRLKSFRFGADELALLSQLSKDLKITEAEVVRRGLKELLKAAES